MYSLQLDRLSFTMLIISNCIHHFVPAIVRLKKFYIPVSIMIIKTILPYKYYYDDVNEIDEGNHALQEFLAARNPKQQHSCTLESYLIKPIQRILKYPLLLQQLRNMTDSRSDEHLHLCGRYIEEDNKKKPSSNEIKLNGIELN